MTKNLLSFLHINFILIHVWYLVPGQSRKMASQRPSPSKKIVAGNKDSVEQNTVSGKKCMYPFDFAYNFWIICTTGGH